MLRARAVGLALCVCLPAVLTACSSEQEQYCAAVEENQQRLGETVADGGPGALLEALPVFEDLAAEAPGDLRDEWQQVTSRLRTLQAALDEAGVEADEYRDDEPPEGVDEDQRRRIRAAADDLASRQTVSALAGVQQHALDVCGMPLSL